MEFKNIILKKENHVAFVILNRPHKLNAVNEDVVGEILSAFNEINQDNNIRALVFTGAGRGFCAGGDISGGKEGEKAASQAVGEGQAEIVRMSVRIMGKITYELHNLLIPTIAMVNGPAVGGGFDYALACDLRIGSEKARFRVGYTPLGAVPATGSAWLLPRIVGLPKAIELIYMGDFIEADEAYKLGILNRLVRSEELEKETAALAQRIAEGPPIALRLDKMQIYRGLQIDLGTALELGSACQASALTSQDAKDGILAMREKRKPLFRGK